MPLGEPKPGLEEIDSMLFVQLHDRLLPVRRPPVAEFVSTKLALASLGSDLRNLHVEQLFDSPLHIVLRRVTMNFERVLVVPRSPVNPFFGDQRPQQDLMRLQLDTGFRLRWLNACHGSVFVCRESAIGPFKSQDSLAIACLVKRARLDLV